MAATAAHLVDRVIPEIAPIRQWVLSLPHRIRYLCAYDPETTTAVRRLLVRAVTGLPAPTAVAQDASACRAHSPAP